MLLLEPGRADPEQRPAARDDVECGDHLGQERGLPVGHARDEGAQAEARGASGKRPQQGVGLEHLLVGLAEHRELEEVVHDEQRVEAGVLRGDRLGGHAFEQLVGGHARVREVGDLKTDSGGWHA